MNELTKTKFSGLKLCKLVGISHNQFQSFKLAGLIENKHKYTLNDVIYVAISNVFREYKMSWVSIYNLYRIVFDSPENFLNLINENSFLDLDFILLMPSDNKVRFMLTPKKYFQKIPLQSFVDSLKEPINFEYGFFVENISEENKQLVYGVYVWKVIDKIIRNSKELDLKVDVESILKSA